MVLSFVPLDSPHRGLPVSTMSCGMYRTASLLDSAWLGQALATLTPCLKHPSVPSTQ